MDELLNHEHRVTVTEAKIVLRRDLNRAIKIVAAVERERLTSAYADVIRRKQKREQPCD